MCLFVNGDRHYKNTKSGVIAGRYSWEPDRVLQTPNAFVAKQPLIVKKRVRRNQNDPNSFHSPYQYTPIRFGVTLTANMYAKPGQFSSKVEEGHHAFLYSATTLSWRDRPSLTASGVVTIYGVIPAGARYYIGTSDEVVTDKIIYFRDLKSLRDHYGMTKVGKPVRGDY